MLPLKLVRSLVFGETINNNPLLLLPQIHNHSRQDDHSGDNADDDGGDNDDDDDDRKQRGKSRTPFLLFLPTGELVTDTYRLATIARDMGMDLHPTPSLSHIILSYPPPRPPSSPSSPSSSSTFPSSWSSSSLSSSASLPDDTVPLPFPCLSAAPISHLRALVKLSKGLFKLVFAPKAITGVGGTESNWNCSSMSLFSRLSGERIGTMEGFSRALAGLGWTLFKTMEKKPPMGKSVVYLFRKVDRKRVRACSGGPGNECRIRELRLPTLDFRNAPLRILHYILLMTDDIFYLA